MATAETARQAEVDPALAEPQVDVAAAAPQSDPCPACGCPVEPLDKFCPACGTPSEITRVTPAGERSSSSVPSEHPPATTAQKYFRCDNCGSEVATDPDQRSYVCPFCDSSYVVEFTPAETNRTAPEFVIGFAVTPEAAQEKFRQWISNNGWLRPGDLKRAAADKMKGVYLPFWSFSMLAGSKWEADIGEYWYRTETYTTTDAKGNRVTRTRRVRETEWWPLAGRHHRYYSGYLVSGSRGLPQDVAESIKPFNLPALKRYQPYFLAGWFNEEYSVEQDEALVACQAEFQRREQHNVAAFLPGDTHRSLQLTTEFSAVNSDLCLLPVYLLSYRYRGKVYRFLVNGQTGRFHGRKPVSWRRIASLVAAVLLGILTLIVLILVLTHG